MELTNLTLQNFRSYHDKKIEFAQNPIIFVGPNGSGKTNIIESIRFLCLSRSFRTHLDKHLINWREDYTRVTGQFNKEEVKTNATLEIFLEKSAYTTRKIIKNNHQPIKAAELIGQWPIVLFNPNDLNLVFESPLKRRRYLDLIISQIDQKYYQSLLELAKIIHQRNSLLVQIRDHQAQDEELAFWDQSLTDLAAQITTQRTKTIKKLNQTLTAHYQATSQSKKDHLTIKYRQNFKNEADFTAKLIQNRQLEIIRGRTIYGPQRDDFKLYLNDKDITTHGSRGEIRTAIIAIKQSELKFLATHLEQKPILLLDDVFSELDLDRRQQLFQIVTNQQTFITTTDLKTIDPTLTKKAQIIELTKNVSTR